MPRLFIGIALPPFVKEGLLSLCCGIPGARWTDRESLHLTLKFIGDCDGGVMRDAADALAGVEHSSFQMRLSGIGFFPPRQVPRIIWAGVDKNPALESLQKKIENKLADTGIEREKRKFHAHITLARLTDAPIAKVSQYLSENALYKSGVFGADKFILYESHLSKNGSIYEQLAEYKLSHCCPK